jgi:hypothetical protein
MRSELELKNLERKVYLTYSQDGLMDLVAGLFVLAFGLDLVLHLNLAAMSSILLLGLFWGAKRMITYPRIGFVKFSPERIRMLKRAVWVMQFALLVAMLLGGVVFLGFSGYLPGLRTFFRQYSLLLFGVVLAGLMSLVAVLLDNWRLHIYAALTLIAFAVGHLVGLHARFFMIPLGVVITISGLVVLIRFLCKYPIPAEQEGQ